MTAPITMRERAAERRVASYVIATRIGRAPPAVIDYLLASPPGRVVSALMMIERPVQRPVDDRRIVSYRPEARIEAIISAVCEEWDIRRADLVSHRRAKYIVKPRQVAMYVAKHLTGRTFPEIGRLIGNRDHTTIMHGVRAVEAAILADHVFADRVARVTSQFAPVS